MYTHQSRREAVNALFDHADSQGHSLGAAWHTAYQSRVVCVDCGLAYRVCGREGAWVVSGPVESGPMEYGIGSRD